MSVKMILSVCVRLRQGAWPESKGGVCTLDVIWILINCNMLLVSGIIFTAPVHSKPLYLIDCILYNTSPPVFCVCVGGVSVKHC